MYLYCYNYLNPTYIDFLVQTVQVLDIYLAVSHFGEVSGRYSMKFLHVYIDIQWMSITCTFNLDL